MRTAAAAAAGSLTDLTWAVIVCTQASSTAEDDSTAGGRGSEYVMGPVNGVWLVRGPWVWKIECFDGVRPD